MIIFKNKDGSISEKTAKYYDNIVAYAARYNLKNTETALNLAIKLHDGQYRDGGAPYIIHPLEATNYLILLGVWNPIFKMNLDNSHNEKLALEQSNQDLDILLSSMLLHDTLEDCMQKLPENGEEFITVYHLHPDILFFVRILKKDKMSPDYTPENYFGTITEYWQTSIMKIADRVSNCSTIDSFNTKRMEKYVIEIVKYFYPMISNAKQSFPEFSRMLTIMKYLIVSITETVASVLNLDNVLSHELYEKTYFFIKGFAVSRDMKNTQKALTLSRIYYDGLTRKSGDAFIIHPLRVCSYLIALKIDNDAICSAALLHEIINKCQLDYNGIEILTKYHVTPKVLDYVRLLANSEHYPLELYYKALMEYPEVLLLKLSNRAHTCTTLINSSDEEIRTYVEECENYIYPLCEYGIKHYPKYGNSIQIMYYHIRSICNIVKHLKLF